MTRCSQSNSSSHGHNNRSSGSVKLFGVKLTSGDVSLIVKKSASVGNLVISSSHSSNNNSAASEGGGYHSDDPTAQAGSSSRPKKRGIPWTEAEHRQFLLGLQKLGKGDWKGISKQFVPSRSASQVASHAQKYYLRQSNNTTRKKRRSLFDMVSGVAKEAPSTSVQFSTPPLAADDETLALSLSKEAADTNNSMPSLDLSLKLAHIPFPPQLSSPNASSSSNDGTRKFFPEILRPSRVIPEEIMGMPQLTLGDTSTVKIEPSPLSLRLLGEP